MVATKNKETIQFMFGICACTPAIKLNNNQQIAITLRKMYVINKIASFAALYQVNNFIPCNKHLYVLAKKIDFIIKNISVKILWLQLKDIWRN